MTTTVCYNYINSLCDLQVNTTRLMDTLVVCFEIVTDIDPFPVGYLNTTYENAKGKYF